jgi:hypothetical protein
MINKKKIVEYVKSQNNNLMNQKIGAFNLIFKERFVNDINFQSVFKTITSMLPEHYVDKIDVVYIGEFDFFKNKDINASYMDGAIYVSSHQDDEQDLLDDIVHEISHSLEEAYSDIIYGDKQIKDNFLHKREILERDLRHYGYDTTKYDFSKTEYDKELDMFLYEEVEYDKLNNFIQGLFLTEYSTVSLREYFAVGFEEYYINKSLYLQEICPYIYNKLILLENLELGGEDEIYF